MTQLMAHAQELHARSDELAAVAARVPALEQELHNTRSELAEKSEGIADMQVGVQCFFPGRNICRCRRTDEQQR